MRGSSSEAAGVLGTGGTGATPSAGFQSTDWEEAQTGKAVGVGCHAEKGKNRRSGQVALPSRGGSQLAGTGLRPLLARVAGDRLQSPAPPLRREARGPCLSFLPAPGPAQPSWPGTAGLNEDRAVSGVPTLLLPPPRADPGTKRKSLTTGRSIGPSIPPAPGRHECPDPPSLWLAADGPGPSRGPRTSPGPLAAARSPPRTRARSRTDSPLRTRAQLLAPHTFAHARRARSCGAGGRGRGGGGSRDGPTRRRPE